MSPAAEPGTPGAGSEDPHAAHPAGFASGGGGAGTSRGGGERRVLFWIAFAFSAFQIFTAAYSILPSQIVRAVHVGFLLLLVFPLLRRPGKGRLSVIASWVLALLGFATGVYQWIHYEDLIVNAGFLGLRDIAVGVVLIVLVFEAARRMLGIALPIVCAAFLAYCFLGQYLPAPLDHRGYAFDQVIEHMAFGVEGIYGLPIYVSSSFVFLFVLFGAFLEHAGVLTFFTDVALGLVGHTRGGPAKVAVVASALMGTISGSGVANAVTVGQFTIPLMKRFGYAPAFAGGVEATASMGGQIMPPVMGAVAFIMAETLDIPYHTVAKAAILPALFYFGSAFWAVHLEAVRCGLSGLPKSECPNALQALRGRWSLALPLVALVYLLFSGFTPLYAGTMGLALTAVLILAGAALRGVSQQSMRVLLWVCIGVAAAASVWSGIALVAGLIALLMLWNTFTRGGRATLALCRDSLAEGARSALPVGIACALVGIIVGTMTLTGVATTFGRTIVTIGEHSLFLSLFLTMVTCLILGMGIPTIPTYIITSSLAGPALQHLGVPLIISHMFVFYFGILADLTPPVALAAFAVAPIARASGTAIGVQALRIALAGFVIPYLAVYAPALMLQDGGAMAQAIGFPLAVAYIVLKTSLAIGAWGVVAIGVLQQPLTWWERTLAALAAVSLIAALPLTDEIGFALAAVAIAAHLIRIRRRAAPAR